MSKKHYIIPIFVPHKGCPHDCIFCNQKKITGSNEVIDSKYIYDKVNEYLKTMDDDAFIEISFFGGSFTGIPLDYQNELLEAASQIYKEGKINAIRLSTRPDYINEFILDNLKRHHVKIIELGVQSLDEVVLLAAERGHSAYDVYRAVKLIKKYEFDLGLQMMIGLPEDNKEKDIETAKKIIELEPDFVRIYPAIIIKDTYMEYMYNSGKYIPLSIDEAVNISKEVYLMFVKHNIPVIRIGLQASEDINLGKDVVAGPFHPAFRELVESSILNEMIEYLINMYFTDKTEIIVRVSNKTISKLYADKKKYFNYLLKKFIEKKIIVKKDESLEDKCINLECDTFSRKLSIKDYANITN